MPTGELLLEMQAWSLDRKIFESKLKIQEWHKRFNGNVYVSFSGGKCSTVLLHLVRSVYPNVKAVFCDTGIVYPEVKELIGTVENIDIVKPKYGNIAKKLKKNKDDVLPFKDAVTIYGYPLISKEVSGMIEIARNKPNSEQAKRMEGLKDGQTFYKTNGTFKDMVGLPFKISSKCCYVMKDRPLLEYEKQNQAHPYIGVLTSGSPEEELLWKRNGCNSYNTERPLSKPLAFWTEYDVSAYIKEYNLPICKLYSSGFCKIGCAFCGFKLHTEEGETRFQKLKKIHPELYNYCMEGGRFAMNPDYKERKMFRNWHPKRIWVPSEDGLGMKFVFDAVNSLYGEQFFRYF